ncbi:MULTISPECIES: DUF3048 domain-containing protein [Nocardia]|uniref:DUF3048 domain-containing protein n=1 Tax=Nocardia TaxID=1817 RepID=UPI0018947E21|nr:MULTISPECIES: DUF3048 domain-containing protein [Nocardia]MBF6351914.1 DUF3048 domain-containing protein [Nocardia flavorosea]
MRQRWWMWLAAFLTTMGMCAVSACSGSGTRPERGPPGPGTSSTVGAPVLVAKIDNSPQARPPVGLGAADVVYVEPVEGGLSRLAAVFSTDKPPVIGPVRSARETDLTLLAQFGDPTLASSGAAPELVASVDRASLQNASAERQPGAYFRDYSRVAPHNMFVYSDQLPVGGGWPQASQLRFGPTPAGGEPTQHQEARYPATTIGFDWSPGQNQWLVSMDGAPYTATDIGRVVAGTVVLQSVQVHDSAVSDIAGSVSPLVETTGSGQALVLRDGLAFPAEWSRPSLQAGTTYTTPAGAAIPFAPGQVWTVLVPAQLW